MAVQDDRIRMLNDSEPNADGRYVLYWMQQAQRAELNHALEYAAACANGTGLSLVVCFGLKEDYPDANERHFAFMVEGLAEVRKALHGRGIKFVVRRGSPDAVALALGQDASLLVCDRGYLRHQRQWRERVAREAGRRVVQVEGEAVVPVERVSDKAEYAARTIRPKLQRLRAEYLIALNAARLNKSSLALPLKSDVDLSRPQNVLQELNVDRSVAPVSRFRGGTAEARARLTRFLRSKLSGYAEARNDPSDPQCSMLSPYLHFGQISPVEVACKVDAAKSGSRADRAAYLEELIVRRELAINYVFYRSDYDKYSALPDWARKTLAAHKGDRRPARYTRDDLENARTDDRYWNAAMQEMRKTGYMHNHMRMYWGKMILAWSNTPEYGYATALYLNNKYFLDGRDPSSYANVGWIFGLHDRPWQERPVFGTVRSMTAGGLERKFDIDAYVRWVDGL